MNEIPRILFNWSAHTDKQHQVAALQRVLRAGGLERYVSLR